MNLPGEEVVALRAAAHERAVAWLDGRLDVSAPRDAATVVLLRDAGRTGLRGLEVFLLRRVVSMAFAPGMHVFPGGRVDRRDADQDIPWDGRPPASWAGDLATDTNGARSLVVAAVRETFEECGVLLASRAAMPAWDVLDAERRAVLDGTAGMADVLRRHGLALQADLLRPVGHWVTPAFESRRYDTRFLLAALPPGQQARDLGGESVQARWWPVGDALRAGRSGNAAMMLPTLAVLAQLAPLASLDDVAAATFDLARVEPVAVRHGDDIVLRLR